jgi:hypothetical protein
MDELGNELLTGAALAHDHHGGIRAGHAPSQLHGLSERRRDAKQGDLVAIPVLLEKLDPEISRLARHHDGM